jgi:hypothetical protein
MGIFQRRPKHDTSVQVPDDIHEARAMLAEASDQHKRTLIAGFSISQLTSELAARRELNHFGESIQITFTRRTA